MARHEAHTASPTAQDPYDFLLTAEADDKRGVRRALAVAMALHAAALFAALPNLYPDQAPAIDRPERLFVMQPVKFKQPEIPPTERPREERRMIPVPDKTPDEIEPVVVDQPRPEIDLDYGDAVIGIPDAPPAPPAPPMPSRLRVGGAIQAPERIAYVEPRYTEMARKTRTQGMVILEAVIDERGHVIDVRPLKTLSFGLTEEAIKAVEQWRYEPPTAGDRPISVVMTITVHFRLT